MGSLLKWSKTPFLYKVLFVLTLSLSIYIVYHPNSQEGFANADASKFVSISGADVYDHSYVGMYDGLFVRQPRLDFEYTKIFNHADIDSNTWVLDVGSGTGHLCGRLHKNGIRCVGMDRSKAMIQRSQETYPDARFVMADATQTAHNYYNKFDIISCLYFTYYEMSNKEQFLQNCMQWLRPGGRLYLHLVDPEVIDPILPVGNVLININPQDFSDRKITTTRAVFENKEYKSDFQRLGDERFSLVETVVDKRSGLVKRLQRDLTVPAIQKSVAKARALGFTSEGGQEMNECGYEGQYIYVFRKAEGI